MKFLPETTPGAARFLLHGAAVRLCLLLAAWLVLWWPTHQRLAEGIWLQPDHVYTAWLTAVAWCLFAWRLRTVRWQQERRAQPWAWAFMVLGAVFYVLGRSQGLEQIELVACLILLFAFLLLAGGWHAVKRMRFPLLFWLFTLPYPAWLVDQITAPLKMGLSKGVEMLLYAAGYPVARSGVVIALGQYRLLVEDACSGLHSLIFLMALGLIYLHFTGPRREPHRWILVAALLPLALFANFVRVLILSLSTYHFGDVLAQGLWHSVAGVMLFVSGFAALYLLDSALGRLFAHRPPAALQTAWQPDRPSLMALFQGLSWRQTLGAVSLWLMTGLLVLVLTPRVMLAELQPMPKLQSLLPAQIGDWRHDVASDDRYVSVETTSDSHGIYDQVLERTYVDSAGHRAMLVMAYGARQMGSAYQVHRPESCYQASGFLLLQAHDATLDLSGHAFTVRQIFAQQNNRREAVTYWMTIGNKATMPGVARKIEQLRHGLRGEIPNGMLVRVSSLERESGQGFLRHQAFVADLQRVLPGWFGLPPSEHH